MTTTALQRLRDRVVRTPGPEVPVQKATLLGLLDDLLQRHAAARGEHWSARPPPGGSAVVLVDYEQGAAFLGHDKGPPNE